MWFQFLVYGTLLTMAGWALHRALNMMREAVSHDDTGYRITETLRTFEWVFLALVFIAGGFIMLEVFMMWPLNNKGEL